MGLNKSLILIFVAMVILQNVSAYCDTGQIDVNSASAEDLDKITNVGPVIAQNIINARPFNSVDDLIRVSRIGEVTLEEIKNQGLACVNEEKNNTEKEEEKTSEEDTKQEEVIPPKIEETPPQPDLIPIEAETIVLNPSNSKDIKSEENSGITDKNKYAIYGFAIFCFLILFLFIFRRIRLRKNGFE